MRTLMLLVLSLGISSTAAAATAQDCLDEVVEAIDVAMAEYPDIYDVNCKSKGQSQIVMTLRLYCEEPDINGLAPSFGLGVLLNDTAQTCWVTDELSAPGCELGYSETVVFDDIRELRLAKRGIRALCRDLSHEFRRSQRGGGGGGNNSSPRLSVMPERTAD